MSKNLILIISTSLLFISCAKFNTIPANVSYYDKISGNYSNTPDSCYNIHLSLTESRQTDLTLLGLLDEKFKADFDNLNIDISVLNRKQLKLKVYHKNDLVHEKIIKGSVKQNKFFHPRSQFLLIPFFPAFLLYKNNRSRLFAKDDTLYIEYTSNNGGWIVIAGGGSRHQERLVFKK